MMTSIEVEQQFRADLQILLDKYNAELEASDHYIGYAECGEDIRMTVSIPAVYDENHDIVSEWVEVDLGRWIN